MCLPYFTISVHCVLFTEDCITLASCSLGPNRVLNGMYTLVLAAVSARVRGLILCPPRQHQRLPCFYRVTRLNQDLLHGRPNSEGLRAHGNLQLHSLQNNNQLIIVKLITFLDFYFPDIGVQWRFNGGDLRV